MRPEILAINKPLDFLSKFYHQGVFIGGLAPG